MASAPARPTGAAAGLPAAGAAAVLLLVVLGLARAVSLGSSDAVEMPTIGSPRPAETRARISASR